MSVKLKVPLALVELTKGVREIEFPAGSVAAILNALEAKCPGTSGKIFLEKDKTRPFVCVMVGGKDIRLLKGLDTNVNDGDVMSIVFLVAGG